MLGVSSALCINMIGSAARTEKAAGRPKPTGLCSLRAFLGEGGRDAGVIGWLDQERGDSSRRRGRLTMLLL